MVATTSPLSRCHYRGTLTDGTEFDSSWLGYMDDVTHVFLATEDINKFAKKAWDFMYFLALWGNNWICGSVIFFNQHRLISAEVGKSKYIRIYNKPGCLVVRKKRQSCFSEEISERKMTMHRKETTKEMHFMILYIQYNYIYHFIITVYIRSIPVTRQLYRHQPIQLGILYTVKRGNVGMIHQRK